MCLVNPCILWDIVKIEFFFFVTNQAWWLWELLNPSSWVVNYCLVMIYFSQLWAVASYSCYSHCYSTIWKSFCPCIMTELHYVSWIGACTVIYCGFIVLWTNELVERKYKLQLLWGLSGNYNPIPIWYLISTSILLYFGIVGVSVLMHKSRKGEGKFQWLAYI